MRRAAACGVAAILVVTAWATTTKSRLYVCLEGQRPDDAVVEVTDVVS
jgi:hypothetical protein